MTSYYLQIKTDNEELSLLYSNHSTFHKGDSGLDLYTPKDIEFLPGETKLVDLEIKINKAPIAGNKIKEDKIGKFIISILNM